MAFDEFASQLAKEEIARREKEAAKNTPRRPRKTNMSEGRISCSGHSVHSLYAVKANGDISKRPIESRAIISEYSQNTFCPVWRPAEQDVTGFRRGAASHSPRER